MTIELSNKIWVKGIWTCPLTLGRGQHGDILACMYRPVDSDLWQAKYRFRYYVDRKNFGSDDLKNWYHVKTHSTDEAHIFKIFQDLLEQIAHNVGDPPSALDYTPLDCLGDDPLVMQRLGANPMMHAKTLKAGELP